MFTCQHKAFCLYLIVIVVVAGTGNMGPERGLWTSCAECSCSRVQIKICNQTTQADAARNTVTVADLPCIQDPCVSKQQKRKSENTFEVMHLQLPCNRTLHIEPTRTHTIPRINIRTLQYWIRNRVKQAKITVSVFILCPKEWKMLNVMTKAGPHTSEVLVPTGLLTHNYKRKQQEIQAANKYEDSTIWCVYLPKCLRTELVSWNWLETAGPMGGNSGAGALVC